MRQSSTRSVGFMETGINDTRISSRNTGFLSNCSHYARFNRWTKQFTEPEGLPHHRISSISIGPCAIISEIHFNLTKLYKLILMTNINLEFVFTRAELITLAINLRYLQRRSTNRSVSTKETDCANVKSVSVRRSNADNQCRIDKIFHPKTINEYRSST